MRFFISTQSNIFVFVIIAHLQGTAHLNRWIAIEDIYAVELVNTVIVHNLASANSSSSVPPNTDVSIYTRILCKATLSK